MWTPELRKEVVELFDEAQRLNLKRNHAGWLSKTQGLSMYRSPNGLRGTIDGLTVLQFAFLVELANDGRVSRAVRRMCLGYRSGSKVANALMREGYVRLDHGRLGCSQLFATLTVKGWDFIAALPDPADN